jgi:hypothetical protein
MNKPTREKIVSLFQTNVVKILGYHNVNIDWYEKNVFQLTVKKNTHPCAFVRCDGLRMARRFISDGLDRHIIQNH